MPTWTQQTTPWDSGGMVLDVAWSPSVGCFVAVGNNSNIGGTWVTIMKSTNGTTWVNKGNPWGVSNAFPYGVCWDAVLNLFVAIAFVATAGTHVIATSPDGDTWTLQSGSPITAGGGAQVLVRCDPNTGKLCAIATANGKISYSDNATSWTTIDNAWYIASGGTSTGAPYGLTYSPDLGLWVMTGGGTGAHPQCVSTSPDRITWTLRSTPFDDTSGFSLVETVAWSQRLGKFFAGGNSSTIRTLGHPTDAVLMSSFDGVNWTLETTPLDSATSQNTVWTITNVNDDFLIATTNDQDTGTHAMMSSVDGSTWTYETTPWNTGYPQAAYGAYSPSLDLVVVGGINGPASSVILSAPYTPSAIPLLRNFVRLTA